MILDLLPLACICALNALAALAVAACVFRNGEGDRRDRLVAAVVGAAALPVLEVVALSAISALKPLPLRALSLAAPCALILMAGASARRRAVDDVRAFLRTWGHVLRSPTLGFALLPGLLGLLLALAAAGYLEVWAWDSLGYHLPIVFDALQEGRFREIPTHIPYMNVYPRGGEHLFAFVRLWLPDDTWIDVAQVPAAVGGVVVTAALARRTGSSPPVAVVCASMWLAVPVVALQIPTNYVDVYFACWLLCAAYFVTADLDLMRSLLAGLSLAMLLGCKAVALVPAGIFGIVFVARALRHRRPVFAAVAFVVASLGTSVYVRNILRHGNPVWPVEVALGPLRFVGVDPAGPMYVQGLDPNTAQLPAPLRFVVSLLAEPRHHLYDMRLGGFGPMVKLLLVGLSLSAGMLLWRHKTLASTSIRRMAAPALVVCATVALPMAHWPRFSLAVPAALLVGAASWIQRAAAGARAAALCALSVAALVGLMRALPAFTGNTGPPILSLVDASFEERLRAASIDESPLSWHALKAPLLPGEAIAFDNSVEAPGLLWRRDGRTRVLYLDVSAPPASLAEWLHTNRVRAMLLGRAGPARNIISTLGGRLRHRARCPEDPCDIYDVVQ